MDKKESENNNDNNQATRSSRVERVVLSSRSSSPDRLRRAQDVHSRSASFLDDRELVAADAFSQSSSSSGAVPILIRHSSRATSRTSRTTYSDDSHSDGSDTSGEEQVVSERGHRRLRSCPNGLFKSKAVLSEEKSAAKSEEKTLVDKTVGSRKRANSL